MGATFAHPPRGQRLKYTAPLGTFRSASAIGPHQRLPPPAPGPRSRVPRGLLRGAGGGAVGAGATVPRVRDLRGRDPPAGWELLMQLRGSNGGSVVARVRGSRAGMFNIRASCGTNPFRTPYVLVRPMCTGQVRGTEAGRSRKGEGAKERGGWSTGNGPPPPLGFRIVNGWPR
jgi:hypothetical protein